LGVLKDIQWIKYLDFGFGCLTLENLRISVPFSTSPVWGDPRYQEDSKSDDVEEVKPQVRQMLRKKNREFRPKSMKHGDFPSGYD
jgi:hypothetical protein